MSTDVPKGQSAIKLASEYHRQTQSGTTLETSDGSAKRLEFQLEWNGTEQERQSHRPLLESIKKTGLEAATARLKELDGLEQAAVKGEFEDAVRRFKIWLPQANKLISEVLEAKQAPTKESSPTEKGQPKGTDEVVPQLTGATATESGPDEEECNATWSAIDELVEEASRVLDLKGMPKAVVDGYRTAYLI